MSFVTVPEILQPLVLSGRALIFDTQRFFIVPSHTTFSVEVYPDRSGKTWILTSFVFSPVRDYSTGEVVYSTPSEPFFITYECQGSYRKFSVEGYRSLFYPVNTLLEVTRLNPLCITISNQSSRILVGDSTSVWVEVDSALWRRYKQEKGWNP